MLPHSKVNYQLESHISSLAAWQENAKGGKRKNASSRVKFCPRKMIAGRKGFGA
jgi:hypothetical protein